VMKMLMTEWTLSIRSIPVEARRLACAVMRVFSTIRGTRRLDARPAEPAEDWWQQSTGRSVRAGDMPPPADGLLAVAQPPTRANTIDGDLVFSSPVQSSYIRDIRLSDTVGGLRLYGTHALSAAPSGAAIQVCGNNAGSLGGQLFGVPPA
jgi:hypothetical protein